MQSNRSDAFVLTRLFPFYGQLQRLTSNALLVFLPGIRQTLSEISKPIRREHLYPWRPTGTMFEYLLPLCLLEFARLKRSVSI